MHEPPAVIYPIGRSPALAAGLVVLWLAGAAVALVGLLAGGAVDWRLALIAAVLAGAGHLSLRGWRTLPMGELHWNGHEWLTRADGSTAVLAEVRVHLDLQSHLLLCLHPAAGRARWAWAARGAAPNRWNDLRRAVVAHRALQAEPATVP